MKSFLKKNILRATFIMLLISIASVSYMIYDLNKTEKSIGNSLIKKPMQNTEVSLDLFFKPIINTLETSIDRAKTGEFDGFSGEKLNRYFIPLISNFPQISSIGFAHSEGFEYDILQDENGWLNRLVWIDKTGDIEFWSKWELDSLKYDWKKTKEWIDKIKHDPRDRPWYVGAKEKMGEIYWTEPYVYNTNQSIGMTASTMWHLPNDEKSYIIAFDLTLEDVTTFTKDIKVSENGKAFVLNDKGMYIGLPKDKSFVDENSIKANVLKSVDSINIPEIKLAYNHWKTHENENDSVFTISLDGEIWWGKFFKYYLNEDHYLIAGVVIPEFDFLKEVKQSKKIIIICFSFVLILTLFVFYSYREARKSNLKLIISNRDVFQKNLIIEEKNKDILDSIHYTKRLQNAMLPTEERFYEIFPSSFILYKPKDIVSGDFYWLEVIETDSPQNKIVYFAAADCTGHGVPGAMVSFICSNALTKVLIEEKITSPEKILNRVREIIIEHFGRSSDNIMDGMDISLCSLNLDTNVLEWAGANNPLWIIKNNENEFDSTEVSIILEEIKADKQPVGKYFFEKPFTNHIVQLLKGDIIYLFSDGYHDQFGGMFNKKYKTKRFKEFLLSIRDKSMEIQKELLDKEFENWKGECEQTDDVCTLGIKID